MINYLIPSDSDYIKTLNPSVLISYLYANGWTFEKNINDDLIVLSYGGNKKSRNNVWVPKVNGSSDFVSLVYKILDTQSSLKQISIGKILEDLQTIAIGDVLRYHSEDPMNPDLNTIPFNEGISAFHKIRQMASAAASSVSLKRPIHSRKPTKEVKEYLDTLRLGQTENGSYLIKVISPISMSDPIAGEIEDYSEQIPFSRRAVVELVSGLNAINDVSQKQFRDGVFDINPFLEAVPRGISANLCEALSTNDEKVPLENDSSIDLSVTWSYLIKDKSLPTQSSVSIETKSLPYISRAAKELRVRNPETITLRGWVNLLEKDSREEPGAFRILGKTPEGFRAVRVKLDQTDIDVALESYKTGYIVSAVGELEKENTSYFLRNARNVHLVREDFLPDVVEDES